jgi:hypothetical protein
LGAAAPRPAAIPDVLAAFISPPEQSALLLGVEIDRGYENLASVFRPKLEELWGVIATWAGGATWAIVVLTSNLRRRDALRTRGGLFAVAHDRVETSGRARPGKALLA